MLLLRPLSSARQVPRADCNAASASHHPTPFSRPCITVHREYRRIFFLTLPSLSLQMLDSGCIDNHEQSCGAESCCSFWARKGECHAGNKAWMSVECTQSCSLCSPQPAALKQHPRNKRLAVKPTGLSWPKPHTRREQARASAATTTGTKSIEARGRHEALSAPGMPQRVDVSLVLHDVAPGQIDRSQVRSPPAAASIHGDSHLGAFA